VTTEKGALVNDVDESDFRDFVTASWPRLVRTALVLAGNQQAAEDLAQQALVITHRKWTTIRNTEAPYAYTRAVMVNLQNSWWRRHRVTELTYAVVPEIGSGTSAIDQIDDRDAVCRALLALPARMRAVLVLRYLEGLTEAETAQTLDCSVGSVKSQTSRGLDRLRSVLDAAPRIMSTEVQR